MDWDRWWEKEGMAHAIVRVDGQLRTLRANIYRDLDAPLSVSPPSYFIEGKLQLLTSDGWTDLHQVGTAEDGKYCSRYEELLVRLASYAEAIYPGMYDSEANQNSYKTRLTWKDAK